MTRAMIAVIVSLMFIFGVGLAKSMAQDMMSKSGETSELLGATVKNPQDEDLGIITNVLTGLDGRAAFAVLNYWISDDTQKRIAIPFGALSCKGQDCVLNASKNTLDSAPTFVSEDDLTEPRLAEKIYRYFGIPPYWTEQGTQK